MCVTFNCIDLLKDRDEDKQEPRLRVQVIQTLNKTYCANTYPTLWPKEGNMLCAGIQDIESGACPVIYL
jgi:hypothetical protein